MKGETIHIFEELPLAGGSLAGILDPTNREKTPFSSEVPPVK